MRRNEIYGDIINAYGNAEELKSPVTRKLEWKGPVRSLVAEPGPDQLYNDMYGVFADP